MKRDYLKIKKYCNKIKIDLIVTPWDEKGVEILLRRIKGKVIKIASIDANLNFHFCDYVSKQKIPTIISSGTCTYDELKITKKYLKKINVHLCLCIVLLHILLKKKIKI